MPSTASRGRTDGAGNLPAPSLVLPADMAAQGFCLRPETEADAVFLRRLYISMRWDELAPLIDWSETQKHDFLSAQFDLQRVHYARHYQGGDFAVIDCRGESIGRLYLFRSPGEIRVVDIGFLPDWRNRGLGTRVLQAVFDEARPRAQRVSIHVENFNPAQRLYHRLGFREISRTGPYLLMQWPETSGR